jgi:alginate O-acetyltransferase complex protein AlgI
MLFNSWHYLLFFPLVVLVYYVLPHRLRLPLLLLSSYYFYMAWKPVYVLLIVLSTWIDYWCGLQIANNEGNQALRKRWMWASVVSNLSILIYFKYFSFFADTAQSAFLLLGYEFTFSVQEVLLPMGISFYTFQSMSYVLDVYQRKTSVEKSLAWFSLYVVFFPQLVAGPIERAGHLLNELKKKITFDSSNINAGLQRIALGLFKKVVVADRLAIVTDDVFAHYTEAAPLTLFIGAVFFSFQIYADFSGYSDIAIGSARVMGFRIMENFRFPFSARSVTGFWHRWHISLSTWFRDYVYIPLKGNRAGKPRMYFNIMTTYLVSGLWHGARMNFIWWGAVNGLMVCVEKAMGVNNKPSKLILGGMQTIAVFAFTVLAFVIFRSETISQAASIIFSITTWQALSGVISVMPDATDLWLGFIGILLMQFIQYLPESRWREHIDALPFAIKAPVYSMFVLYIVFFGVFENRQFIYFQF